MHPSEQGVIPEVMEVRHTALRGPEIAHRRRNIDRLDASPAEPHHRFRVEVETPHPELPAHYSNERCDWIDAKSVQRIGDAGPQRFDIDPPVGNLSALDAHAR